MCAKGEITLLDTQDKYDYVKNILVKRMSGYRRNSFKLESLYKIIRDSTESDAYITFSYQEFYNMFKKECIDGNIPYRKFSISKEGFLDKKQKYPYAAIHVEVSPRTRRTKS